MVPYQGRMALRVARAALALGGLAWYPFTPGSGISFALVFLIAYAIFAVGTLFEDRFDSQPSALVALVIDGTFFAVAKWLFPLGWLPALIYGYLLTSAVLMHSLTRVLITFGVSLALMSVLSPLNVSLLWNGLGSGGAAIAFSIYKHYLERRMSNTLRHNMVVRSQAQGAREAERERIAADFHDGPLQNFISFQMRLEILRKLLARDVETAAEELRQLQDLCRTQVAELRGFVRSMRPVDEGVSLRASLSRMVDQFQRDSGISASFTSAEFNDPANTEVSLELLQVVREILNNVQKHSGASRLVISIGRRGEKLEVKAEDNGGGFPFSGSFNLDELDLLRLGPVSIRRRVRSMNGEMQLESRPGQGSSLEIRVPV
jgi:signal transduction histidine kinase